MHNTKQPYSITALAAYSDEVKRFYLFNLSSFITKCLETCSYFLVFSYVCLSGRIKRTVGEQYFEKRIAKPIWKPNKISWFYLRIFFTRVKICIVGPTTLNFIVTSALKFIFNFIFTPHPPLQNALLAERKLFNLQTKQKTGIQK